MNTTSRRAIYTAVVGGYERILRVPRELVDGVDAYVFTDTPDLAEGLGWTVVPIAAALPTDSVRSARMIKILGHEQLRSYEQTLWIDNRVELAAPVGPLFDTYLAKADLALPIHSYRGSVRDEFGAVLRGGYDNPRLVREQLRSYGLSSPESLQDGALWTAILFRRRSPDVDRFNMIWAQNVLRYSRRDQLSVTLAIRESGVSAEVIALDNHQSEWHLWRSLDAAGRRPNAGTTIGSKVFRYSPRDRAIDALWKSKNRIRRWVTSG